MLRPCWGCLWVFNFYSWIRKEKLEPVRENIVNECVQKWKGNCVNFTIFFCEYVQCFFFFEELVNTLMWPPASSYPDKCTVSCLMLMWCNFERVGSPIVWCYPWLTLMSVFADYHLIDVFHWFAWVIFNFSIGAIALVLNNIHHSIIVFCNISWISTKFVNRIDYMQFMWTQNYSYIIHSPFDKMITW